MRELPPTSKYLSAPDEPVDDVERERLSARLGDAYASGALGEEAYRTCLDQVFAAGTLGQLAGVAASLPAEPLYDTPAIVAESAAQPPGRVNQASGGLVWVGVGAGVVVLALLAVLIVFLIL